MNNYQEYALKKVKFECLDVNKNAAVVKIDGDNLVISQNEDYTIVDYNLSISSLGIEGLEYFDGQWKSCEKGNFIIPISFNESISKIRINLDGGIIDPIELAVKYVHANREAWDVKHSEELLKSYKENLRLCYAAGPQGRTLYFNRCSESCKKTVVEWYAINMTMNQSGTKYFLTVDEITDDRCFSNCSPVGCLEGNRIVIYIGYIIKQYDAKGVLLIEKRSDNLRDKI